MSSLIASPTAFAAVLGCLTLAAAFGYRALWLRWRNDGATPTGFGFGLAPIMLVAALIGDAPFTLVASLAITAVATPVYWIDDLVHVKAQLRILTSFAAGTAIGFVFLGSIGLWWPMLAIALILIGCVCVALTNMVNFYDGADLNLASFIVLTSVFLLWFPGAGSVWLWVAAATLAFIVPFAIINSRPRMLYLGDAGSFAFAGLLTTMAAAFFRDITYVAPEAAIPAALPTIDVAYVFAVRLAQGHDLLTRNYLHLYQRLNRRYRGFGYLAPQLVNGALCLCAATGLQLAGVGRIVSVIAAMLIVTIPCYFLARRLLLAGPPEGPLYEASR